MVFTNHANAEGEGNDSKQFRNGRGHLILKLLKQFGDVSLVNVTDAFFVRERLFFRPPADALGGLLSSYSLQKPVWVTFRFLPLIKQGRSYCHNLDVFTGGTKVKFRMITSWKHLVKLCFLSLDQEKVSDYEMKLMDLDVEQLGIPVSSGSDD